MRAQQDRSELVDRFSRRSMIALMFVGLILGGTGLTIALSPPGGIASGDNLQWWLVPVAIAILIALITSVLSRRFSPDSAETRTVLNDEWRRTNLLRASRGALMAVLIGQWPLGLILGFMTRPHLEPQRVASAMAGATIMLGIVTLVALFFYYDRE